MDHLIPTRAEEVSPAWLTDALRVAGFSADTVVSLTSVPVGSVTSSVHRLSLAYVNPSSDAPRTLIWKCSTPDVEIRAAFSGGYEREVMFYRDVAAKVRARIPRCFLADYDAETRDHVILLEDFQSSHRAGALYESLSAEELKPVVRELAALHASEWDAEVPNPPMPEVWQRYYRQELEANRSYFGAVVGESTLASFTSYEELLDEWIPMLNAGPQALVHWDTHPANLLFPHREGDRPVIIDWQAWRTGAPMRDVALALVMSLDAATRREIESVLIDEYVGALETHGVHYDGAQALAHYRAAVALVWLSAVNFTRRRAVWQADLEAAMPTRIQRAAAALSDILRA